MIAKERLEQALAAQDNLRGRLPDSILDTVRTALRAQLEELNTSIDLTPRRKQVTVLLADLSSFTTASEQMDAEDVSNLLNAIWQRVDTILHNYGGRIDKHMGDAVMALWGVDQAREDDAERAVRAGLEILKDKIGDTFQSDFSGLDLTMLGFRIGIHTGPVLLGPMGLTREFTAMGETMDVANALQNAAPVGGVLISQATCDMVRGLFVLEAQPSFKFKGKNEALAAYQAIRAQPRTYRMTRRGIEGIVTPLIGRKAEWGELCAAYQTAQSCRRMAVVTLLADGGMGKSRLMDEFESHWGGPGLAFHSRGDPQRQHVPYAMIHDLFNHFCNIQENDPPAEARRKLEAVYVQWLGAGGSESAAIAGHLLGFDFSDSPYLHGLLNDPHQLQNRALAAIRNFLQAVSGQTQVMIYLDDVHWVDDGSLDIFLKVIQTLQDRPIFALIATRPSLFERFPDWDQKLPGATRIRLQTLSLEDGRTLAGYILQRVPQVPPVLLHTLAESADGNPFYMEELIKMLIEQQIILPAPLEWRVDLNRLHSFAIPPSLTGVLQARLDHLEPEEDRIIQYAAVIGRVFWDQAIAALRTGGRLDLGRRLSSLCQKGLIESRPTSTITGAQEFIFKQGILQEVAYERVLKAHRRSYHRQVAEWLVAESGSEAEYSGLIAEHYEKAGETHHAALWQTRAGDQALTAYLQPQAQQAYQRALDLLGASLEQPLPVKADPVRLLPIFENLYEVFTRQGDTQQAEAAVMAMLETARAIPDTPAEIRALCNRADVEERLSNPTARRYSIELAEKIVFAMPNPDPALQARVLWGKATVVRGQAHYTEAMSLLERTSLLAQQAGDRERLGSTYNMMGLVHMHEGRRDEARKFILQALEIQRSLGHQRFEAGLLNNMGETYRVENNFTQAIDYYYQALAVYQKIGSNDGEKMVQNNLGGTLVGQGNYAEALKLLLAVKQPPPPGNYILSETDRFLAQVYLRLDRREEALESARQALLFSLELKNPTQLGPAWRVLGLVSAELGKPVSAPDLDSERGDRLMTALECFQASLDVLNVEGHKAEYEETLRVMKEWGVR